MLTRYGDLLLDAAATATPQLQQLAVTHVNDLIALTLGATGDHAAAARRARGAACRDQGRHRRAPCRAWPLRCGDREATPPAGALGAAPVRIDGSTFTEFLLARRLAQAHGVLSDPRFRARPIGTIAFEAGLANQAYFNRTFRTRFGATPSDIRSRLPGRC